MEVTESEQRDGGGMVVRSSWDKSYCSVIMFTAQCWKTSRNLLSSWVKNVVVLQD